MERRKLLIAAVGVATINYVACGAGRDQNVSSGNLMAPDTGEVVDSAPDQGPAFDFGPADSATPDAPTDSSAGADVKDSDAGDGD